MYHDTQFVWDLKVDPLSVLERLFNKESLLEGLY